MWTELLSGTDGVSPLRSFRENGSISVVSVERDALYVELVHDLDEGEAAAITSAVHNNADRLLLDERDGRKAARRHDVPVTGVVGVLMRAAETEILDLESELDRLREAGFWISDELYR